MRTILLISPDAGLRARLLREMRDSSVFWATSEEDALRTLRTTEVDLVLDDAAPPLTRFSHFIARLRQLSPSSVVVCLYPAESLTPDDDDALGAADFFLRKPFSSRDLFAVVHQAEQKQGLLLELSALRAQHADQGRAASKPGMVPAEGEESPPPVTAAVNEFAKALAAGFDLPRMLGRFLDAVSGLLRPSRCALLLADRTGAEFWIRAHRGLAPHVVESVRLPADGGLPLWLQSQGRLIYVEEARAHPHDSQVREIARELSVLQAMVAVPLSVQGELVGILTLGQRITGVPYRRSETEILFNLATHLATTIRNIQLHNELQYKNVYIERILAHMSNGVITIDRAEKVSIMNRRAEEILGLSAHEVLRRDLRALPSPLGDLLYDSLTTGRTMRRADIHLALRKLPLEVSTYPIAGDDPTPLGAVMVFEDLSAAKQLAAERRQAEQFQLLSQVTARVSDEIKNPLVSITTFMELLEERFDDSDFRHRFFTVVGRDVKRLVEVFEKLTALVGEGEFNFKVVDMHEVVEECLAGLGAQAGADAANGARILHLTDEVSGKRVTVSVYHDSGVPKVKSDPVQLKKAQAYLIWYLMRKSPGEEAKLSISIGLSDTPEEHVQLLISSRTAEVDAQEIERIFDPVKAIQESLIDLGPSVSQRIIEALGGWLRVRKARHDISFLVLLPVIPT